jgi:two-component system invasion response regulator UvrY
MRVKKVRALLVDDKERFLDSIERYLVSVPELNVDCIGKATSGEEAIMLSMELKPDLILMDLTMPGMGGLEATQLIKQEANAPRVVILTIHESDEYRRAAREAGADGFLTKSEFTEKLVSVVQSMFPESLNTSDCPGHGTATTNVPQSKDG